MDRFLKATILLLMGAFLFMNVMDGSVLFYINQRFVTLTWLAAGGFFLVGASYFLLSGRHSSASLGREPLTWVGLLIACLPLLFGWLAPSQPLGAAAIANREINMSGITSAAPSAGGSARNLGSAEKNIIDWLSDFQRNDPATFNGEEARLIGFVYRDDRFPEDTFMVARFTVSCCVADAAPIGLVVRWPDAAELPLDQWVEVNGRFQSGIFNGQETPILIAEEIILIDPPRHPYLYL